jgi:hypothetical protein
MKRVLFYELVCLVALESIMYLHVEYGYFWIPIIVAAAIVAMIVFADALIAAAEGCDDSVSCITLRSSLCIAKPVKLAVYASSSIFTLGSFICACMGLWVPMVVNAALLIVLYVYALCRY